MYGNGTNTPQGLQPRCYLNGATWNQQTNTYLIKSGYGTSLFKGDPVKRDADGVIVRADVNDAIVGVFWGCEYVDSAGFVQKLPYWRASTVPSTQFPIIANIIDDPNVLFDIQVASGAGGTVAAPSIAAIQIFSNANFSNVVTNYNALPSGVTPAPNPSSGSFTTGLSCFYLASNTINTGNPTYNLTIVRLTPFPGNDAGVIFNNATVVINNHVYKGGTGTAGV